MKTNNTKWKCSVCSNSCGEVTKTFNSLLCMYAFLTRQPGSGKKMWFKEHSQEHRELISAGGKVIAIWSGERGYWRERTTKDCVEDWEEYGNETGDVLIKDEGDAFNLALSVH
ncbi:hypothetical protein RA290_22555 (plasmid) [Pantoea agglomerans]|uniref:hypothetical protein n=1 Tax=Enterobacter agglomerans TaxID=549 RepID=UPI003AB02DCE